MKLYFQPSVVALTLLVSVAPEATGQEAARDPLQVEGEVGASVFFGNTDQTLITTRMGLDWTGERWGYSGGANFSFGQSTDEAGDTFVNKRSWNVTSTGEYVGFGRVSPTVSGRLVSSLEKRIDLRVAIGAGASLEAVRSDATHLDLGLSLQAERTDPRPGSDGVDPPSKTLARWSGRIRFRQELSGGTVIFTSDTDFHPELSTFGNLTFTSENAFAFQLTEVVSLKLTFIDNYDSEAVSRGAETNNDGQVVFSVLSSF